MWGAYDQTKANMDLDAAAGINTYVWAADSSFMPDIRADGRFHVIQDVGTGANVGSETGGWLLGDEEDMTAPDNACPGNQNSRKVGDGRMTMANYGKGLALPPGDRADLGHDIHNWWANTAEADCYANAVDVASVDMYWFTDPFDGVNHRYGYLYGENVKNLRRAALSDGKAQPLWNFIETSWPFTESAAQGGRAILPRMRSAAWHSIIAGARGIMWFQHSFGGPHAGDHHTIRSNSEGTRPMVTSVDAQIKSLAPVLNSSTVTGSYTKTGDVEALVKWDGSNFYVFAGARLGATDDGLLDAMHRQRDGHPARRERQQSPSRTGPSPTPSPTRTPSTSTGSTEAPAAGCDRHCAVDTSVNVVVRGGAWRLKAGYPILSIGRDVPRSPPAADTGCGPGGPARAGGLRRVS